MDAVDRRRPATDSPDCSSGEPVAVRRRVSLDCSRTGSDMRRRNCQQSSKPEATDGNRGDCDQLLDTAVVSSGSGDNKSVLVRDSHTSDAEKLRTDSTEASGARSVEQHERDSVASETSEGCKRTGCGETSEGVTGATTEKAAETFDGGCGSDAKNISPVGGSSYSPVELDLSNQSASETLDEEKERVDRVFTIIAGDVSKISQLTFRFYTVAANSLRKFVSGVENRDSPRPDVCSDEFEERLDAIKAYVHEFCTVTRKQETSKSPAVTVHRHLSSSDSTSVIHDATRSEDKGMSVMHGPVRQTHSIRRATNTIGKSRNVVARQHKLMSQFYASAQRFVSKAETSCQLILDCLKTIVTVLTQAVRACLVIDSVLGGLDSEGKSIPWFSDAASLVADLASEALLQGEMAMQLHKDSSDALKATSLDLEDMKGYQEHGAVVLRDVIAIGDRLLDLVRQSNGGGANMRKLEWDIKTMRYLLNPHLRSMKRSSNLIKKQSSLCDDTLAVVLRTQALVSKNSCTAVDVATKAVEYIFIPAGISLQ